MGEKRYMMQIETLGRLTGYINIRKVTSKWNFLADIRGIFLMTNVQYGKEI